MSFACKLLGLGLGTSEMKVKMRYRQLARKYHPDKNNQEVTGLPASEASDFFKLLNNANMFLRGKMWWIHGTHEFGANPRIPFLLLSCLS